jgi:anti-sigma B factor antagonist
MELHVRQLEGNISAVELEGELDLYNAQELKDLIKRTYEASPRGLVLDLRKLGYIDSSGISVLLFAFTRAKKQDVRISFVNVHGPVRKVIELTSLLGFFPIADSYDEALGMMS